MRSLTKVAVRSWIPLVTLLVGLGAVSACGEDATSTPIPVTVERTADGWTLVREGAPYHIRGAGGSSRLALIADSGGDSVRTWGAGLLAETRVGPDGVERPFLDLAHHLGLSVAAGYWMEHPRHGNLDYADDAQAAAQLARLEAFVEEHKDHPAILLWGIGNEVESHFDDPDLIFRRLNEAAKRVKAIDPDHPTMIVTAEIGNGTVERFLRLCPDVDILGVNSYGGLASLAERLAEAGFARPYLVSEYGTLGQWETGATEWGAPFELTTTERADRLADDQAEQIDGAPSCLGGYAFLWGHKQEVTGTWYGMFLPTGEKTASVDVLTHAWSGRWPEDRVPTVGPLEIDPPGLRLAPGQTVRISTTGADPEGQPLRWEWELRSEQTDRGLGGENEKVTELHANQIQEIGPGEIRLTAPDQPGPYRVFVRVLDPSGGAAAANLPIHVGE